MFKRTALEAVGLFDEQYHMFAEEIDLFRRLSRDGWTAWVLPSERATHYEGQTSRNHPDPVTASKFRQQSYRSICIYYSKHHSWLTASLLRGMLAVRITVRLVRSLVPMSLLGDDERSPAEHLGALANVVRRCPYARHTPRHSVRLVPAERRVTHGWYTHKLARLHPGHR